MGSVGDEIGLPFFQFFEGCNIMKYCHDTWRFLVNSLDGGKKHLKNALNAMEGKFEIKALGGTLLEAVF